MAPLQDITNTVTPATGPNPNVFPLVKGQIMRGGLSNSSNIPWLQSKLLSQSTPDPDEEQRDIQCVYTPNEFPAELQEATSNNWNDKDLLRKTFLVPKPADADSRTKAKKSPIQFPLCLIKSAKTLDDKARVINYWISLSHAEQKAVMKDLQSHYRAPTASDSPKHKRRRTQAQDDDGDDSSNSRTTIVTIADSQELRDQFAAASQSSKSAKRQPKRKVSDPAKSTAQLNSTLVREKKAALHAALVEFLGLTRKDGDFSGSHELAILEYRTVGTPPKGGGGAKYTANAKRQLICFDQDAANLLLGGETSCTTLELAGLEIHYLNDDPVPPAVASQAARKRHKGTSFEQNLAELPDEAHLETSASDFVAV